MTAAQQHIARLGREIRIIIKSAIEISYYSRGAWTYEHVLKMSKAERDVAVEFIEERLEIAKKSTFPIY